ncbi:NAD(P)-binding protein [Calocera cornea HHB12733]|uniref:NAD(P)-binding protein n=1 Tax=Calocera cornea HHB12733 TaxID=1353952 RepID=A0A165DWW1_9BASI|nr:NAD(P)-binding protein [Calocera cornea HHB12733]
MPAPIENMPVTAHNTIYPGIEPSKFIGTLKDKVVFITGASRGIGEATAIAFAKSGATLFLASRKQETLDMVQSDILKAVPDAKACRKEFSKVDIVISNSGTMEDFSQTIAQRDPDIWWKTWEVNVKGSFNVAHYALPALAETKGYFIFVSSVGAQVRRKGASSYQSGKHAVNRIAEFAAIESAPDGVKVFAIHPGGVKTELSKAGGPELAKVLNDDVQLPAWAMVRLVQGKEDYLSGRYVSVNWDLDELEERWKEAIISEDALKNRLALPSAAYAA